MQTLIDTFVSTRRKLERVTEQHANGMVSRSEWLAVVIDAKGAEYDLYRRVEELETLEWEAKRRETKK